MQTNIKRISLTTVALLLVATLALPALVSAQRGEGQTRGEQARATALERRQSIEENREARTADIEQRVAERRAQVLQDVCERRQEQVSRLVPRLANQSTRLASAMDNVYERVQDFHETGQLTVENYDELNGAVADAQANAVAAVEVVVGYEFEFDCGNPSLGDQTFAFRSAVAEAREALKDYRANLVNLISSMRSAAAEQAEAGQPEEETDDTSDIEETEGVEEEEADA